MDEKARRRELADFLKTRRARISAAEAGFRTNSKRRTPGLRREEVAELADVGVTWYTWLEQAREIKVSAQVLEKIARALTLTSYEKRHLFVLANQPPPEDANQEQTMSPALQHLLDELNLSPAYVTGRLWKILGWNNAAATLFGDFNKLPPDERNFLLFAFTDNGVRQLFVDWEDFAQSVLARFREACGHHYAADPEATRLIEAIKHTSPEFEPMWQRHDLRGGKAHWRIEMKHAQVGRLVMEETVLQIGGAPDLQLTTYTPVQNSGTAEKMQQLIASSNS